jgi:hypothetical protein
MGEMKMASNCDTVEQMEEALNSRRTLKGPLSMSTELIRTRGEPRDQDLIVTTLDRAEQNADGSTEHNPVERRIFHNGRDVTPVAQPDPLEGLYDRSGYNRRVARARATLDNFDDVVNQDVPIPQSVVLAALHEQFGPEFAYILGVDKGFRETLLQVHAASPERATLMAVQKMESLTEDELAGYMNHKSFRKWRERK